jgi:hypothetical protein
MVTLTTATEAVNHWAPEAARIDHMLHNFDDLLPETDEGQTPIAEETRQDVEDALMQARLGMDTVLGAYSRVLFHERTVIQRYQPHLVSPQAMASTRSGAGSTQFGLRGERRPGERE